MTQALESTRTRRLIRSKTIRKRRSFKNSSLVSSPFLSSLSLSFSSLSVSLGALLDAFRTALVHNPKSIKLNLPKRFCKLYTRNRTFHPFWLLVSTKLAELRTVFSTVVTIRVSAFGQSPTKGETNSDNPGISLGRVSRHPDHRAKQTANFIERSIRVSKGLILFVHIFGSTFRLYTERRPRFHL